jgi:hypothetical protein
MSDPHTAEEWQMAVDAAAGLRGIADCRMYGLLGGGPTINVARCDEILALGEARGVRPSKPAGDLMVDLLTPPTFEQVMENPAAYALKCAGLKDTPELREQYRKGNFEQPGTKDR